MSDCKGTLSASFRPHRSSLVLAILVSALAFGCAGNGRQQWVEGGVRRGTITVTRAPDRIGFLHTYKDTKDRIVRVEYFRNQVLDRTHSIEHRDYDTGGRLSTVYFSDYQGAPMVGPDGFATRRSTFESRPSGDLLLSYSYFDLADHPMRLSPGHFKEENLFRGDVIQRVRYYDPDGERVAVAFGELKGVHEIRYFYLSGTTPITMETLFNESGKPISKRQLSGSTRRWSSSTVYYDHGRGGKHGHGHRTH